MQSVSSEEKQAALGAFIDPDPPPLETLDRSTLEPWPICPQQAWLREQGKEGPLPAIVDTGELVHLAFSAGVKFWLDACADPDGYGMSAFNKEALVRNAVLSAVNGSRPDLQPDAIAACRASIWDFVELVTGVNPENILAFDGGESHGKSGQLAWDLPEAGVRYTSEFDFLSQSRSPEVLEEDDWKSGWKIHWPSDVYKSFQFQSHAFLALNNFPHAKAIDVRIWDVRRGRRAYPVRFERRDLAAFTARIHAALQARFDYGETPVPWPVAEKCAVCPVARHCCVSGEFGEIAGDPQKALREFIALDAKHGALEGSLKAYVKAHGPIEADGCRFATEHASAPRTQLIRSKTTKRAKLEENDGDSNGK